MTTKSIQLGWATGRKDNIHPIGGGATRLNLDGFGNHLDLILDARVPSHLDLILDGPISNLAKIIARFDIKATKIEAGWQCRSI